MFMAGLARTLPPQQTTTPRTASYARLWHGRFPSLDLIDRLSVHPHPEIARVPAALHPLRRLIRDLQLLPFPLHHLSVLLEILPRRLRRIPRRRHVPARETSRACAPTSSYEPPARCSADASPSSAVVYCDEQDPKIQLPQRAIGQLAELPRFGQRREDRDANRCRHAPGTAPDAESVRSTPAAEGKLPKSLPPQLPKHRVLKRQTVGVRKHERLADVQRRLRKHRILPARPILRCSSSSSPEPPRGLPASRRLRARCKPPSARWPAPPSPPARAVALSSLRIPSWMYFAR